MIIVTIKFGTQSNRQYDYLFHDNKNFMISQEHPGKILTGCSHGVPLYNTIYFLSCKKVNSIPAHVTSALTLIGNNIVEISSIKKTTQIIAQQALNNQPKINPKTQSSADLPTIIKKDLHTKYIQDIDDEIAFLEDYLNEADFTTVSRTTVQQRLTIAKRRKQLYESQV